MLSEPLLDGAIVERCVVSVNFHPVQLDCAFLNVLGASGVDIGSEGHVLERNVVDVEKEGIARHAVVEQ